MSRLERKVRELEEGPTTGYEKLGDELAQRGTAIVAALEAGHTHALKTRGTDDCRLGCAVLRSLAEALGVIQAEALGQEAADRGHAWSGLVQICNDALSGQPVDVERDAELQRLEEALTFGQAASLATAQRKANHD